MKKLVLLFSTTHAALAAEEVLRKAELWHELIPPPRTLSPSCGLGILVRETDFPHIENLLEEAHAPFAEVHPMEWRAL